MANKPTNQTPKKGNNTKQSQNNENITNSVNSNNVNNLNNVIDPKQVNVTQQTTQKLDKYAMVRSALGEQQLAYEEMMHSIPDGNKDKNPMQEQYKGSQQVGYQRNAKETDMVSGGKGPNKQFNVKHSPYIPGKTESHTGADAPNQRIGVRQETTNQNNKNDGIRAIEETKNTSGIRVGEEKSNNGIRMETEKNTIGMRQTSSKENKNVRVETGVHMMGGKTSLGYLSSGKDGGVYLSGSVVTNFNGIFQNKDLAEACGIKYNPKDENKTIRVINGEAQKLTKTQISDMLVSKGYQKEKADNLAEQAYTALHADVARQGHIVTHNNKFETNKVQNVNKLNAKDKVSVLLHNENVMIQQKMGHTKTDVGILIERPMIKTARTFKNYGTGMVEQTGEVGQGVRQAKRGLMIASLALPSVGLRVNAQFQRESQWHVNGFVMIEANGAKAQLTVAEAKKLLQNQGFSADDLKQINIGVDFQKFANQKLKANKKDAKNNPLTDKQLTILNTFSKSRGVTVNDRKMEIRKVYRKFGIDVIQDHGHYSVQRLQAKYKQVCKRYGGEEFVPLELKAAFKEDIKLAKNDTYKDLAKRHPKIRKIGMMAKSSVQKQGGDVGQGLSVTTRGMTYVKNGVVAGVKAFWAQNMLIREAAQKALWLASKTSLGAAKAANKLGFKTVGSKLDTANRKIGVVSDKFKTKNREINANVRNAKGNFRSKVSELNAKFNPYTKAKNKLKAKAAERARKLIEKNKFAAALHAVGGKFAKAFRFAGAAKKVLIKYLAIGLGILLLLIIIATTVSSFMAMVASFFNMNTQEYDTKQYLANTLHNYFEQDMNYITNLKNTYQDSTYNEESNPHVDHIDHIYVTYEDYKNYDKYAEEAKEEDAVDFMQTSNFGEIMSMATIKFDHNLGHLKDKWFSDDPKKDKQFKAVEDYIESLYYGSHNLIIRVDSQTYSSTDVVDGVQVDPDNTWSYTVYTIYATYKTYYFDSLFDCQLLDAPQRTLSESSTTGQLGGFTQSWDSIYYSLREHGFSHNGAAGMMSNIAHESGDRSTSNWHNTNPNPNIDGQFSEGSGPYGICQWTSTGGRKSDLVAWCEANGYDYTSTSGQIAFMFHEIDNVPAYSSTKSAVYNTSSSAYDIANIIGNNYEVYGGGEETSRGNLATTIANYYSAQSSDWSSLMSTGDRIAEIAIAANGQIHYTQGTEGYVGTRTADGTTADAMVGFADRSNGTDCSGFVRCCYIEAGMANIPPYTTSSYPDSGWLPISQAVPGDVAWRSGHCGIVTGDGKTMELHTCYFSSKNSCVSDCSPGNLSSFSRVYRYWQ